MDALHRTVQVKEKRQRMVRIGSEDKMVLFFHEYQVRDKDRQNVQVSPSLGLADRETKEIR